ncbi:MAG: ATP-binding protein [Bacteroidales bacterium]|nr:ATP-binding protein [Bacteroidales bacterium]
MFDFKLDEKGYIKRRESFDLEFKQNFQLGDNLLKYIKTLVGMANNKGGQIIFGIKDSPHVPLGMTNNRFSDTDPKEIDKNIREYFSQELSWKTETHMIGDKKFGILSVEASEEKPVICKKNKDNILREGAIYYRYRGETKEIEYAELRKILEAEKEKERLLWISHINKIAVAGPKNVQLLDTYKGEISVGDHKILIDKTIIDKLNFIKEGHFTEKEGEGIPTLKLIGNVEGIDDAALAFNPDTIYPLTTSDLQSRLHLNQYQMQAVIYAFKIKEKEKYHAEIKNGKKVTIHKYSEHLVELLERKLATDGKLQECIDFYKNRLTPKKN